MIRWPALLGALLATAGCAHYAPVAVADHPITVEQLTSNRERWDGQIVEVSGWLVHSCDDFERACGLVSKRNGRGDAVFFSPTEQDRVVLRNLIGEKITVRGCYDGCLGAGFKDNNDGSATLTMCVEHLTDATLLTPSKDNI